MVPTGSKSPPQDEQETAEPFSLKGFKETLLRPLNYYEKFANCNGTAIESLESSLRSICYILPGRFKDSEFVSEISKKNSEWWFSIKLINACFFSLKTKQNHFVLLSYCSVLVVKLVSPL